MGKLLTFFILTILSSGCATRGEFLSESKSGWFNVEPGIGVSQSKTLVFCKAEPNPVCQIPKMESK